MSEQTPPAGLEEMQPPADAAEVRRAEIAAAVKLTQKIAKADHDERSAPPREPTKEMYAAGRKVPMCDEESGSDESFEIRVWQAMYDAALAAK